MSVARISWMVLILLITGAQFTLAQKARQRKVLVKKEMSLNSSDNKTVVATETINFESGFEAREGCSFYAAVVGNEAIGHERPEGLQGESLVTPFCFNVYPTTTTDKVNLCITGATNPVITIYDERDGREVFRSTDASLSEVSLGEKGKGMYVVKVVSEEEIVFRRVVVK